MSSSTHPGIGENGQRVLPDLVVLRLETLRDFAVGGGRRLVRL